MAARAESGNRRAEATGLLAGKQPERPWQVWAGVHSGGERRIDIARACGYKDGSAMKIVNPILVGLGLLWTVIGLNAGDCNAAGAPGGDLGPEYNQPLPARLETLILPEIHFRDSDLTGALQYLGQKARTQSGGAIQVQFVLLLPDDFKPRSELTLDLKSVPFARALQYVGQLAGVKFTAGPHAIIARVDGPLPPEERQAATVAGAARPPDITHTAADFKGPLDEPAVPVVVGNNLYVGGEDGAGIDPTRSGYVAHRGLDARPYELDPIEKDPMGALEADRYRAWRRSWTKPNPDQNAISVKSAASGGGLGMPELATPEEINELESVMFPDLELNHTPLDAVMQLLSRDTFSISNGKTQLSFVTEPGLNASAPVTLNVTNMPLPEALQYIGELANVDFVFQRYAIWVRRKTARD